MAVRQHLVEISIAFLIAGCIFFFYDSPSLERNTPSNSPFNIFNVADRSPEMKNLRMTRQQNCTTAGKAANVNVTYVNATTGEVKWYLINNTDACSKAPLPPSTASPVEVEQKKLFLTTQTYFMTMDSDCTKDNAQSKAQALIAIIARIMVIDVSQLAVKADQVVCGSLTMPFTCGSSNSAEEAAEICHKIVTSACTANSQLNTELRATNCGVQSTSGGGSSTSLYALFALTAIPILCCVGVILMWRSKQWEADNQYMQDTATFSNVAASPQALGTTEYPPAAATYTTPTATPVY